MRIFIQDICILYQSRSKLNSRSDKCTNICFRFYQRKWNSGRVTNFWISKSLSHSHCFDIVFMLSLPNICVLWCEFVNKSKNMKDEYMTSSLVPQPEMFKSADMRIAQHQIGYCEFDTIPCCLNPLYSSCSRYAIYLILLSIWFVWLDSWEFNKIP